MSEKKPKKVIVDGLNNKPKRRFTKTEKQDIIEQVIRQLATFCRPREVVLYLKSTYNVSEGQASQYLKQAREIICRQYGDKASIRAEITQYIQACLMIHADSASLKDKLAVARFVADLHGVMAPQQIALDVKDERQQESDHIIELRALRQKLLNDPEAMESYHRLYERQGGVPNLGQKLPNGLKELPQPPDKEKVIDNDVPTEPIDSGRSQPSGRGDQPDQEGTNVA